MSSNVSVTLKLATSLDGRIALSNGLSQWITNSKSRARVHEMRARHDAVLVGVGTVLADDPLLTARTVPAPAKQPARIVADSRLRTPAHSRLVESAGLGRVILAHADDAESDRFANTGAETWPVGTVTERLDLEQLLRRCEAEGFQRIFLEGGGTLAASFLSAGLVDVLAWFRAPILIGGDGIPAVNALGHEQMDQARRWELQSRESFDADCLEIWTPA
ncbi:RibD family protein [Henriciella barbarensis]|uniref:RibD family protein n=1 Tax=Henriciella barbarensis TaxID=86342 RepID=A0A399R8D9_9PROT|nr:RibD family protein [Henriciella barbarensis]RIJ26167.1 RibD family protein [Henriciella barbarensis]